MAERQTGQTEVPPPKDPDRKRVLNVLAQRRYRQRQRNRLIELERKTAESIRETQGLSPSPEGNSSISNEYQLEFPIYDPPSYGYHGREPTSCFLFPVMQNMQETDSWTNAILSKPWEGTSHTSSVPSNSLVPSNLAPGNSTHMASTHSSPSPNLELQYLDLRPFQIYDNILLNFSESKALRASYEIAILLRCKDSIRDVGLLRTFNETTSISGEPLPPSFLPTEEQQLILHHPILDILPWPAVRSKLIRVFNRAPHLRPCVARDSFAVVRLLQDIEDPAEGLRVSGPDGFDAENWEVGQQFFFNWWWALECSVIERSSALRVLRGAESLYLP